LVTGGRPTRENVARSLPRCVHPPPSACSGRGRSTLLDAALALHGFHHGLDSQCLRSPVPAPLPPQCMRTYGSATRVATLPVVWVSGPGYYDFARSRPTALNALESELPVRCLFIDQHDMNSFMATSPDEGRNCILEALGGLLEPPKTPTPKSSRESSSRRGTHGGGRLSRTES